MKKNIEDITFDDSLLEKYKEKNEKLTMLCKKLDKNKKVQKKYKEYLQTKEDELLKFNYVKKGEYNSVEGEIYDKSVAESGMVNFKLNSNEKNFTNRFNYEKGLC